MSNLDTLQWALLALGAGMVLYGIVGPGLLVAVVGGGIAIARRLDRPS